MNVILILKDRWSRVHLKEDNELEFRSVFEELSVNALVCVDRLNRYQFLVTYGNFLI